MRPLFLFGLAVCLSSAAFAKGPAGKKPPTPAAAKDKAFDCSYTPSQLTNYQPPAVHLPGAVRQKLKKLAQYGTSKATSACKMLPPAGAVTPGPNKGGVVRGDIVVAQQDLKVYRAYSKGPFTCSLDNPATDYGGWWSFEPLGSNKQTYRRKVAVCPSWNDFTMKIECTLKKGTAVIVGPSQSASCTPGPNNCTTRPASFTTRYPASTSHQVFINTRSAARSQFLTNCRTSSW